MAGGRNEVVLSRKPFSSTTKIVLTCFLRHRHILESVISESMNEFNILEPHQAVGWVEERGWWRVCYYVKIFTFLGFRLFDALSFYENDKEAKWLEN